MPFQVLMISNSQNDLRICKQCDKHSEHFQHQQPLNQYVTLNGKLPSTLSNVEVFM